jgi:CubicO group peptidase (beta-lactamase class C family)
MRQTLLPIVASLAMLSGAVVSAAEADQLDPAAVQSFVNTRMGDLVRRSWAPGAVIAVVQRDRILALAGVGTADIDTQRPIDPERTLFRIGSVTKVMTTVAALRMVERGELDLDKDVNRYLATARVPDTFAAPITARVLISHHGGFDTVLHHLQVATEAQARMTPAQIERTLVRVRAPDAPRIYDNLGYGLLGYVLANIAHKSYPALLADEVFAPLGMNHAGVGLSPTRMGDAAQCHELAGDGKIRVCNQAILVDIAQAAGDVSLTGADMARFMIGLLTPERVLHAQTLDQMKNVDLYRLHPMVPGLGLTLWESRAGGRVIYGHTGGIDGFLSLFVLFPGSDVGVFVSFDFGYGSAPAMSLSGLLLADEPSAEMLKARLDPKDAALQFLDEFATQFVPANAPPEALSVQRAAEIPGIEVPAAQLAGVYFRADQSNTLLVNLLAPLTGASVDVNADGSLTVDGKGPFVRFAKSYYRWTTGDGKQKGYAFKVDEAGRQLVTSDEPWKAPFGVWQKQPWYATAQWALLPLPLLILLQLSAFGRLCWEKDMRRRRILRTGAVNAAVFLLALLLELQFGDRFDHADHARATALLWRVLFPVACLGFLYGGWLALRGLLVREGAQPRSWAADAYASAVGISGLGLVWLALLWRMITLFLRAFS